MLVRWRLSRFSLNCVIVWLCKLCRVRLMYGRFRLNVRLSVSVILWCVVLLCVSRRSVLMSCLLLCGCRLRVCVLGCDLWCWVVLMKLRRGNGLRWFDCSLFVLRLACRLMVRRRGVLWNWVMRLVLVVVLLRLCVMVILRLLCRLMSVTLVCRWLVRRFRFWLMFPWTAVLMLRPVLLCWVLMCRLVWLRRGRRL